MRKILFFVLLFFCSVVYSQNINYNLIDLGSRQIKHFFDQQGYEAKSYNHILSVCVDFDGYFIQYQMQYGRCVFVNWFYKEGDFDVVYKKLSTELPIKSHSVVADMNDDILSETCIFIEKKDGVEYTWSLTRNKEDEKYKFKISVYEDN